MTSTNRHLDRCHPCAPSRRRHSNPARREMESKPMDSDYRPVVDRQRGSRRRARKKGRLGWLCNPLVLRTVLALARFGYELARV